MTVTCLRQSCRHCGFHLGSSAAFSPPTTESGLKTFACTWICICTYNQHCLLINVMLSLEDVAYAQDEWIQGRRSIKKGNQRQNSLWSFDVNFQLPETGKLGVQHWDVDILKNDKSTDKSCLSIYMCYIHSNHYSLYTCRSDNFISNWHVKCVKTNIK